MPCACGRTGPPWLPALGELGPIMALTRNEHCVHERKGPYREGRSLPMGRWAWWSRRISTCACSWGVERRLRHCRGEARGTQRSIQVSTSRAWRCTRCSLPRPATSAPGNRWSSACGRRAGCRAGAARTPRTGCGASSMRRSMPPPCAKAGPR
ncbi:ChuX/HutX family heme-like substrate-binding protein [Pseudomonas aeruginosa]